MLLLIALVREFESHRGEILNLFSKKKEGSTAESASGERLAWVGAIRREATREEQRAEVFSIEK